MSKSSTVGDEKRGLLGTSFFLATVMALLPLLLGLALMSFINESSGVVWFVLVSLVALAGLITSFVALKSNKKKVFRSVLISYIVWFTYQLSMATYAILVSGVGFMG